MAQFEHLVTKRVLMTRERRSMEGDRPVSLLVEWRQADQWQKVTRILEKIYRILATIRQSLTFSPKWKGRSIIPYVLCVHRVPKPVNAG